LHPPKAELPFSPAADRNKAPWLALLSARLPSQARVLEIASGTGQHAAHCAGAQPGWSWQPTELGADRLQAIAQRCADAVNVATPLQLDVLAPVWPEALTAHPFDAVLAMNLLHIAPWPVCRALMQGAARHLVPGGLLVIYGPFIVDWQPTAQTNVDFDADLRARNPEWGLRRLADVEQQAQGAGLLLQDRVQMPANNLSLVFRTSAAQEGTRL
jgi:SAM-dependent methyltransferase